MLLLLSRIAFKIVEYSVLRYVEIIWSQFDAFPCIHTERHRTGSEIMSMWYENFNMPSGIWTRNVFSSSTALIAISWFRRDGIICFLFKQVKHMSKWNMIMCSVKVVVSYPLTFTESILLLVAVFNNRNHYSPRPIFAGIIVSRTAFGCKLKVIPFAPGAVTFPSRQW